MTLSRSKDWMDVVSRGMVRDWLMVKFDDEQLVMDLLVDGDGCI